MKRLIFALLLALPVTASATDWYILNVEDETCQTTSSAAFGKDIPWLISPLAARDYLRSKDFNDYKTTKIYKLKNGMGRIVQVETKTTKFTFFTSKLLCEKYLSFGIKKGWFPNLNELK
ncbi:MAG: hypothetical protein AB7T01_11040 [Acidithiobacillus sp.]